MPVLLSKEPVSLEVRGLSVVLGKHRFSEFFSSWKQDSCVKWTGVKQTKATVLSISGLWTQTKSTFPPSPWLVSFHMCTRARCLPAELQGHTMVGPCCRRTWEGSERERAENDVWHFGTRNIIPAGKGSFWEEDDSWCGLWRKMVHLRGYDGRQERHERRETQSNCRGDSAWNEARKWGLQGGSVWPGSWIATKSIVWIAMGLEC